MNNQPMEGSVDEAAGRGSQGPAPEPSVKIPLSPFHKGGDGRGGGSICVSPPEAGKSV